MGKHMTTATKPKPLLTRHMYAIEGQKIESVLDLYDSHSYAKFCARTWGTRTIPMLVTVTPIRAKRARKGMR